MNKLLSLLALVLVTMSCTSSEEYKVPNRTNKTKPLIVIADPFIRAADLSFLPEIESTGTLFYNNNQVENAIATLRNAGCNTVRIRLWKNPSNGHSSLAEVKALSLRVRQAGMKVWLTVHYSDTWADPANQTLPAEWQNLSFADLKLAVAAYTTSILTEIHPNIFQIGNEINNGFLWPQGHLTTNENQFLQLLATASATIRAQAPKTKIMIHYAGIDGANWFFNKVNSVSYDYIGLSYYPIWHGTSLANLQSTINTLGQTYAKRVVLAETAYPFSLGWNDWTNNVVGLDSQIIPAYPASPQGQKNFMVALKTLLKQSPYGQGFSYWGGEFIAFRGNQATNGSSWENQALYDFNNNALPVFQVFNLQ